MIIDADYTWTYVTDAARADADPAERWARAVFEGAPALVRGVLSVGWRAGLGLRLAPRGSSTSVLGWTLRDAGSGSATLLAESRILQAENTVVVAGDTVTWSTAVSYRSGLGRVLWSVAKPVHQLTIPLLLARAKRHLAGS